MNSKANEQKLRIGLSKGRLWESTLELFKSSGIEIFWEERDYKPKSSIKWLELYSLKPRNVPKMVESGMLDAGIVGVDLVKDEKAKVELVLDLKTMPVFIIAAGKKKPDLGKEGKKKIAVATEYTNIAEAYLKKKNIKFELIKTYGSTECFVPEFADMIVDHTQTGETLRKNKLQIFELVMKSTTHLIANKKLSKRKKKMIEELRAMLEEGVGKMSEEHEDFLSEEEVRKNKWKIKEEKQ